MSETDENSEVDVSPKGDETESLAKGPKLLVVDDDEQIIKQIRWALGDEYDVSSATSREEALDVFRRIRPRVVLLDLGLPPRPREATEGLAALEALLREDPLAKIIIASGNAERANAREAVRRGAVDIFPKPIDLDELQVVLTRVYKRVELEREAHEEGRKVGFEDLVGSSAPMQELYAKIRKVGPPNVPVLLTGESGTGKELVAAAIHSVSPRKGGPFIPIHCGAIPENLLESELFGHEKGAFTGADARKKGRFESAQGGTLFLDEIGELAQPLQVKLLRFLQEKTIERIGGGNSIPVDARVIAATNRDLVKDVEAGGFREDLFFRLAVVTVHLPPLRDRGHDVVELASYFADAYAREYGFPGKSLSPAATVAVRIHDWPGNVRELQNRMRRAVVLAEGPTIGPEELELAPPRSVPVEATTDSSDVLSLKVARERMERDLVARAMEESGGNISKAARALGVSRPTLYDLIEKFRLGGES